METIASGYTPAGLDLHATLRRLVATRPDVPVLSLYLDLDPAKVGTTRDRSSAITSLLDEAHKRVEETAADHDAKLSLRADLERAADFLGGFSPKGARGAAVFSASKAGLFEGFPLPRPVRSQAVVDDAPYVAPLVEGADTRDWLIACIDARHARILHGNTERVEEFARLDDHVAGQHEGQSTSDHQRWVEHNVDQHLERAAHEVDELVRVNNFERVVVGGPPEIAPRFEALLGPNAHKRLAGRFAFEVTGTSTDAVREAALPCFEADEREHEHAALQRLADRLGMGERAVAGPVDVRAMLEQQRVETLLFAARRDIDGLEAMIEQAVAQSAEILPVRERPEELDEHAHVAALLRF
jgi:peptide subunit release factor 1 (eRF1)